MDDLTPTRLSDAASISLPYASQILSGVRPWTKRIAIAVYRDSGIKLGPIAEATDDEIDILERFESKAA